MGQEQPRTITATVTFDTMLEDERVATYLARKMATIVDDFVLRIGDKAWRWDKYGDDGHHDGHPRGLIPVDGKEENKKVAPKGEIE